SINYRSEKSEVVFHFELVERGVRNKYGVERERRRKNNVVKAVLYRFDGEKKMPLAEGSRDVDAEIEKILGLTFDDFKKCIALPQGEFAALVKAAPSERVKLVSRIFDLEKYGERLAITVRANSKQAESEAEILLARMQENGCSGDEIGQKQAVLQEENLRLKELADTLKSAEEEWLTQKRLSDEKTEYDGLKLKKESLQGKLSFYGEVREKLKRVPQATELIRLSDLTEKAKKSALEYARKATVLEEKKNLFSSRLEERKKRLRESDLDKEIERETVLLGKAESLEDEFQATAEYKKKLDECLRAYKEADAQCEKEDFARLIAETEEQIKQIGEDVSFTAFFTEQYKGVLLGDTYREVRSDLSEIKEKFPQTESEIQKLIEKYSLSEQSGEESLDLATAKKLFDEREKERKRLVVFRENVEKRKRIYEDNEAKKGRIKEQGVAYRELYEQSKKKLESLGAERAETVKARLEKLKKIKADEEEKIRLEENALRELDKEIGALQGQKTAFEEQAKDGEKNFSLRLKESGFTTLGEAEILVETLGNIERTTADCERFFKEYESVVARISAVDEKKFSSVSAEKTALALEKKRALEEEKSEILGKIAVLEKEIEDGKKKLEKYGELKKQYEEKKKKSEIWEKLRSLTDKNRFMNFIAAEYLQEVCMAASQTLLTLTGGRYYLKYEDEFKAADNLNGGKLRAVKTLSGGETFLVSLSLALALAGAICSKSLRPIEFFFLDEGFGTLDERLVDTVMDVLGKLSTSFSVGVISHVEELKHRIENKVTVTGASEKHGSTVTVETLG
ncbi:MAG: SMC family ATPase, partial [Clostridia bacterium]|nr:SMC family ATPase [Clostridia bacterium]